MLWAESLGEILFVMRHSAAYEDIRREEDSRAKSDPKSDEASFSPRQQKAKSSGKSNQQSTSQKQSSSDWKPGPGKSQADIDRCLRILELEPDRDYTQKEIKKAYRRLAMIHHPDLPTGDHQAFVRLGIASDYLMKQL